MKERERESFFIKTAPSVPVALTDYVREAPISYSLGSNE
jgi:hypothetical protein